MLFSVGPIPVAPATNRALEQDGEQEELGDAETRESYVYEEKAHLHILKQLAETVDRGIVLFGLP